MAAVDDPASILEQFCHDVANLPAEITHLMEEMQAKEAEIQECRNTINQRDGSLQKFIKLNGSLVKNPKEEPYSRMIQSAYDRAAALQEEKIAFSEKAALLLDRQIKRLDIKLRDLQNDGQMPPDPQLPSLLHDSPGNLVERTSNTNTGANTPLQVLSGNAPGGSANIANAAVARMMHAAAAGRLNVPGAAGMGQNHMLNPSHLSNAPAVAAMLNRGGRDGSVGHDAKRRRLNASLAIPAAPSNLARQSSLGPGTPKATTPGSRQGSVGPRVPKKAPRRPAPHQMRKKIHLKGNKRSRHRSGRGGSTTGEDDTASEMDGSDDENASRVGGDGAADEDGMDVDEDSDDTKYCFCQKVSYGNMVGCDNDDCKYQWFHWGCVNLTEEPEGDWLCPICEKLPRSQIKKVRNKD